MLDGKRTKGMRYTGKEKKMDGERRRIDVCRVLWWLRLSMICACTGSMVGGIEMMQWEVGNSVR